MRYDLKGCKCDECGVEMPGELREYDDAENGELCESCRREFVEGEEEEEETEEGGKDG